MLLRLLFTRRCTTRVLRLLHGRKRVVVQHQVARVDVEQTYAISLRMEWLSRLLELLLILRKACLVLVQLAYLDCGLVGELVAFLWLTL